MKRLTTTVLTIALATGIAACSGSSGGEVELFADAMAGHALTVQEATGTPMVWVSSEDGSDPRPGGRPDPSLCSVTGGGTPRLVKPEDTDTARLGDTTLYPVGQLEGFQAPGEVTCSGGEIKHVYVGRS
ncbi:hypothetical protein [Knoellia subterranea]|nr:hypothetical protein [Knoellia subterranea]